jgi:hypothetical protein
MPPLLYGFSIDIKSFGERGTALILTKWINLGAGFTPLDEKWQSHLIYGSAGRFQSGVFKSSLESESGSSVEELAAENLRSYLHILDG